MSPSTQRWILGLLLLGVLGVGSLSLLQNSQAQTSVSKKASKSGTIAITPDDKFVLMVNPEDDSLSVFNTDSDRRIARLKTGTEPWAVVAHPDGQTAFVANRADATVVKVSGINGITPRLNGSAKVGSEPTGLALSPSGSRLYVAEWAEGRISIIDTANMQVVGSIDGPSNPRTVVVTNNGDTNDGDELILVPEFYGRPIRGAEATDESREGLVRVYKTSDLSAQAPIVFKPLDSGFTPEGTNAGAVKTSPNQFFSAAVQGGKIYVTSISASPKGPPRFNGNVFPVVYVGNLASSSEDSGPSGTVNLAKKVAEAIPEGKPRNFLADLADIDFIGSSNVAYTVSRGADVMQRVVFGAGGTTVGSQFNVQIELGVKDGKPACQNPIGVVMANNAPVAYVNCWVSRNLAVVDLSKQALEKTVASGETPTGRDLQVNKGRRFYFTGRGRWAKEAWSSCGSCHPDGLSDNITWSFGAGPRQTTSMDGSFSHGPGRQKQRILNWSAIFEEIHDFERNTRDVSGGLGAITTDGCGDLNEERRVELGGNLDKPARESQDETKPLCVRDWDDIEAFVKTIRPPKALQTLDAASVARGAKLFGMPSGRENNGGCVSCHGGSGWTISRLTFEPSSKTNADLGKAAFKVPVPPLAPTSNFHTLQIAPQPPITDTSTGPAEPAAVGPKQVACVIRNVGSFGVPGDKDKTDALEKKADGTRAQGRGGYNVPSLYGLALGAPYLHHGQASSLNELFSDPLWEQHLHAANPVFLTTGDAEQQKKDLIAFLLSIDANTSEQEVPKGFDICQ